MCGYDLIGRETVLAPAILGGFGPRFAGRWSPFKAYSTNGLASGNCLEEAVCHALCELLERDAWTLAELRSQWIPRARREAWLGPEAGAMGVDDCDAYPRIDLSGAGWPIDELMQKFGRAGLRPVVRDITSDFGVACVIASSADDCVPGFPQAHSGLGAHPNARIAVIRALTELAQSRAVDIQGVREDIQPSDAAPGEFERHTQRVRKIERGRWMLRDEGSQRLFADMRSVQNDDIADDIRLILSALSREGIERAIVVESQRAGVSPGGGDHPGSGVLGFGSGKTGTARGPVLETARGDGVGMPRTVLFTGPTLHPLEARRLLDATVLPPIKRGDLAPVQGLDPGKIIAIIDGEFYQSLAVSPKEILPFLERGVRVYGASSMGALRAVELARFGMIGVGRVFRLFRMGLLDSDDEVALTYCPWSYEAMSQPLVNTRFALRAAVRSRILTC